MAQKFSELTQDFSPERRQRIEEKKAALREEMSLAEIRQALSLTQSTLAETMNVGQAEISKIDTISKKLGYSLSPQPPFERGALVDRCVAPVDRNGMRTAQIFLSAPYGGLSVQWEGNWKLMLYFLIKQLRSRIFPL